MNQPHPPFTPAMQALWDRAMLLTRTRGAYGCTFPMPGTNYRPPCAGSMLNDILFVCTASDEEYEAHLAAVREDMIAWKAQVAASGNKRRELITRANIDLSKLDIRL